MQPDQTPADIPQPTFGTAPGIASINSVYASDNCVEEDHPVNLKGESLEGVEGWEGWADESLAIAEDYAAGGFGGVDVG